MEQQWNNNGTTIRHSKFESDIDDSLLPCFEEFWNEFISIH
jgi:hypothetical protein